MPSIEMHNDAREGADGTVDAKCTLNPEFEVILSGLEDNEGTQKLKFAVEQYHAVLSSLLDLDLLVGVTVANDLGIGLAEVDYGYPNSDTPRYSNDEHVVAIAKTLSVLRDGTPRKHIVYNLHAIIGLFEPDTPEYRFSLGVLAHECAHVVEAKWRETAFPGTSMRSRYPNQVEALLTASAHICWEEYSACRLASYFSDPKSIHDSAKAIASVVSAADSAVQQSYQRYYAGSTFESLVSGAGVAMCEPLRLSSYLLGTLDGKGELFDLTDLVPGLLGSPLLPVINGVHHALRRIWDTRGEWADEEAVFEELRQYVSRAVEIAGIRVDESRSDRFCVAR